jgi:hypothetical protein
VGSHPVSVSPAPTEWNDEPFIVRTVDFHADPDSLRKALDTIATETSPVIIEIADSMTHELDLASVIGTVVEDGGPNLLLNRTVIIRAADDQRPVVNLARPLRFRPLKVKGVDTEEQKKFDAIMDHLTVRLEGLYLARGESFPAGEPLIARATLNGLEIVRCTLDPGGYRQLDGNRAAIRDSLVLQKPYGFAAQDEEDAFNQTPEIVIQRSITGPLFMTSTGYRLALTDSIIDAGSGVDTPPSTAAFAVSGSRAAPATSWGPATQVSGITVFGRMRIESITGRGGIWAQSLEALDNQKGCIKFSYFAATGNRLPQWHACVFGSEALLAFSSEHFGDPAYGRLAHTSDFRIRERGPGDDAMGAFGFLLEAHAWRNLTIRFREFMPLGVRSLVIPVT